MATAPAVRKVFRILGTTDACTHCELCGQDDLRSTVALESLDQDGNGTGEIVYYGSTCGPKAAGWTVREFGKRLRAADRDAKDKAREAELAASTARHEAWQEACIAWCAAERGLVVADRSASLVARWNALVVLITASGQRVFPVTQAFYESDAHARFTADYQQAHPAQH